jgi:hypothetical protein
VTQHILDLFNLRLSQASSTNARGNLLDHNFICYYINEVLNNLKGPILKKNKSEELRSVSVASKRKYRNADHVKHPPATKTLRTYSPIHHYPMEAPHVQPAPFAPLTHIQPLIINPTQMINASQIHKPSHQAPIDPQQIMSFMSMFIPHLQQNIASMQQPTAAVMIPLD